MCRIQEAAKKHIYIADHSVLAIRYPHQTEPQNPVQDGG